jgi:predicted cation transporter
MPIPLLALALAIGGMTIELLWSQGVMIALLGAPVAASVGTALIPLGIVQFRGL